MDRETKVGTGFITKADADKGIITAIFSVFGNVDNGGDIVHPGAFSKTFAETGLQVRVLDQHRTDSVMRALGKPLRLQEVGKDELPPALLEQFPDATGGAEAEVQFLINTPEGSGAFERLKEGVISQWSFAFQPLDADFSEVMIDGEPRTVRNLRTVKLFEISPVLFGMNEATTTTSAKEDEDFQAKPWASFPVGDQFCVYRINAQHEQIGESLGCHDTAEEADAQVRALFASEEDAGKAKDDETVPERSVLEIQVKTTCDRIRESAQMVEDLLFESLKDIDFLLGVAELPAAAGIEMPLLPLIDIDNAPPPDAEAAEIEQDDDKGAGPDNPPTSEDVLVELKKELLELDLLEVEGYGL